MIKMQLDYAQGLLTKGYAGGNQTFSCHDDLLVIQDERDYFYGTRLRNGQLQVDTQGYVVFSSVTPVIDKETRFRLGSY